MIHKFFYFTSMLLLAASSAAVLYFSIFMTLPYEWYVDVTESDIIEPVCAGTSLLTFASEREPRWTIQGGVWGQVFRFDGVQTRETTIFRGSVDDLVPFAYEDNTIRVAYDTAWTDELTPNEPAFREPGLYGAQEFITIYPLPFIKKEKTNYAVDNRFEVINCE